MPVGMHWVVKDRVLHIRISGVFGLHDLQQMGLHISTLLDRSAGRFVHLLFDMSDMKRMPHQIKPVYEASQAFMKHPKVGWVLVFGCEDRIANMVITMVVQMFQARFRFCKSREEGLRLLEEIDTKLPSLQPLFLENSSAEQQR